MKIRSLRFTNLLSFFNRINCYSEEKNIYDFFFHLSTRYKSFNFEFNIIDETNFTYDSEHSNLIELCDFLWERKGWN